MKPYTVVLYWTDEEDTSIYHVEADNPDLAKNACASMIGIVPSMAKIIAIFEGHIESVSEIYSENLIDYWNGDTTLLQVELDKDGRLITVPSGNPIHTDDIDEPGFYFKSPDSGIWIGPFDTEEIALGVYSDQLPELMGD